MRAERRDDNEHAIVKVLRQLQCHVWPMCARELADLLVLIPGATHDRLRLIEIKDPAKAWRLTETQKDTHTLWPIHLIETVDQAIDLVSYARGRIRRAK